MTSAFRHPLLHVGVLSHPQQVALIAALGLHRAEQPLTHFYDGRQSSGGDPRLAKRGSLGSKYVTPREEQ